MDNLSKTAAAMLDTTQQSWAKQQINPQVVEQQAKDALAYPDVMGEYA